MINYEIANNKIVFWVNLERRKYLKSVLVRIDKTTIEDFIREKNLPAADPVENTMIADNSMDETLSGQWSYNLTKEYKKDLINKINNGILNKEKPRSRRPKTTSTVKQRAAAITKKKSTTGTGKSEKIDNSTKKNNISSPSSSDTNRRRKQK